MPLKLLGCEIVRLAAAHLVALQALDHSLLLLVAGEALALAFAAGGWCTSIDRSP